MSIRAQGRAALVEILNGDREPGRRGFYVTTYDPDRVLYVPYSVTRDWDEALLLCRHSGLLTDKLNEMTKEKASCVYHLTLAQGEAEN